MIEPRASSFLSSGDTSILPDSVASAEGELMVHLLEGELMVAQLIKQVKEK